MEDIDLTTAVAEDRCLDCGEQLIVAGWCVNCDDPNDGDLITLFIFLILICQKSRA